MRKKLLIAIISVFAIFGVSDVNAKEPAYYTSSNGVSLTEKEYNFFVEMYNEDFPKGVTQEEYNMYANGNFFDGQIEKKVVEEKAQPATRGTYHSTANKSIQIATSCNSLCTVAISVKWINSPTIRSYDVIGAYLSGVSKSGSITTRSSSSSSTVSATSTKTQKNGFGASVKLPSGSNVTLYQSFVSTKGGHIYASYQHAMSNTTLAVSQQFNVSRIGYGGVFSFYGTATSVYDNMNGVDIAV